MGYIDLKSVKSPDMLAELARRGDAVDLRHASSHAMAHELDRRGYGHFDEESLFSLDETLCAALRVDPIDACRLDDDLRFVRDELVAGRAASAAAMMERVLFPKDPELIAAQYRLAAARRDPATGRPTIA